MAKEKMAVYFQPETIKKIEQEYKEDNCASKTEFIEKAVKFYIGYLRQQEEVNYLSPLITETVKAQIKGSGLPVCFSKSQWSLESCRI